jgi:hypothetical protein
VIITSALATAIADLPTTPSNHAKQPERSRSDLGHAGTNEQRAGEQATTGKTTAVLRLAEGGQM